MTFKNFILHSVNQFVYQLIFRGFKVNDELMNHCVKSFMNNEERRNDKKK